MTLYETLRCLLVVWLGWQFGKLLAERRRRPRRDVEMEHLLRGLDIGPSRETLAEKRLAKGEEIP